MAPFYSGLCRVPFTASNPSTLARSGGPAEGEKQRQAFPGACSIRRGCRTPRGLTSVAEVRRTISFTANPSANPGDEEREQEQPF